MLTYAGHSFRVSCMLALGQLPRPLLQMRLMRLQRERAGKETAGHISLQGSPSWSLSRHSPPCTGDQGFLYRPCGMWHTAARNSLAQTLRVGATQGQTRPWQQMTIMGIPTSNFRCGVHLEGAIWRAHTNCVCTAERLLVAPEAKCGPLDLSSSCATAP